MNTYIQLGLGHELPSGGDLPVSFMWERHSQDTQTPFVEGDGIL